MSFRLSIGLVNQFFGILFHLCQDFFGLGSSFRVEVFGVFFHLASHFFHFFTGFAGGILDFFTEGYFAVAVQVAGIFAFFAHCSKVL